MLVIVLRFVPSIQDRSRFNLNFHFLSPCIICEGRGALSDLAHIRALSFEDHPHGFRSEDTDDTICLRAHAREQTGMHSQHELQCRPLVRWLDVVARSESRWFRRSSPGPASGTGILAISANVCPQNLASGNAPNGTETLPDSPRSPTGTFGPTRHVSQPPWHDLGAPRGALPPGDHASLWRSTRERRRRTAPPHRGTNDRQRTKSHTQYLVTSPPE